MKKKILKNEIRKKLKMRENCTFGGVDKKNIMQFLKKIESIFKSENVERNGERKCIHL